MFLASIFFIHEVDRIPPDGYFLLNNLPLTYWIGIISLVALAYYTAITEGIMEGLVGNLITSTIITMLPSYIHTIPRFTYRNAIYTDTFSFVAQTLYVLRTGHNVIGNETPGLIGYFSGVLMTLTDFDLVVYAKYAPIFVSILLSLMVYLFARLFLKDKRYSLIAVLAFQALSWTGLVYNRQSFAFLLQFFAWLLIVKLSIQKYSRETVIHLILVILALTISHPASSLVISLTPFTILVIRKTFSVLEPERDYSSLRMTPALAVLGSVSWLLWQINFASSFTSLIRQFQTTVNTFLGEPGPISHIAVSGYTPSYHIIASLRQYSSYYVLFTGLLFIIYTIRKNTSMKLAISIFLLCVSPFPFVLYANRWRMVPFMYAILPWSILVAGTYKFLGDHHKRILTLFSKGIKILMVLSVILFLLFLPLTMYGPAAHMYPPSSELTMMEYLTSYGRGSVALIDPGTTIGSYYEASYPHNEVFYIPRFPFQHGAGLDLEGVRTFQVIATTFRAYSKTAYIQIHPPYDEATDDFVVSLSIEGTYGRVFDSDDWHTAYSRVR
jgi:hypothetical protein